MATQAASASLFLPSTLNPARSLSFPKTLLPPASNAPSRAAPIRAAAAEVSAPVGFTPPQLDPNTPSPIFGGSTGGLLRKAQIEEFYAITWESPKEQVFEMPTGGAATMREGPNLLKLSRKEQCLALGTRLRSKYKINYRFYRVFPNGEVQYLHPKDGVYPEKVNPGREGVGVNLRSIGKNASPITVKFTAGESRQWPGAADVVEWESEQLQRSHLRNHHIAGAASATLRASCSPPHSQRTARSSPEACLAMLLSCPGTHLPLLQCLSSNEEGVRMEEEERSKREM